MLRGFSKVSLQELFMLDVNSKGTRGHSCKLVKTRCTRDITKYRGTFFQIKLLTDGTRWISGRWMLLASTYLSLG